MKRRTFRNHLLICVIAAGGVAATGLAEELSPKPPRHIRADRNLVIPAQFSAENASARDEQNLPATVTIPTVRTEEIEQIRGSRSSRTGVFSLQLSQAGVVPPPARDGLQELRGEATSRLTAGSSTGPFGDDQVRLKSLAVGRTPQASAATKAKFDRFIDSRIDTENTLDLVLGRPALLVLKQPPARIQIADEEVANYTLVTEREVSVVGQASGTTVLNFWFADPENPERQEFLSYLVRVLPDPEEKERLEKTYQALETEINRNFPNSVVQLSLVGDRLLLRGQAKDIEDANSILQIVGANAPGGPQNLQMPTQNQPQNNSVININPFGGGFLPLTQMEDGAVDAENYILQPQTNGQVINMLRVAGQQQVSLKVTVAEVDRSATRAIGADLTLGQVGGVARFLSFGPAGAATTGGTLLINRGDFDLAINALKTLNLARALAEPNLVTSNGRPAHLQVGGSFPIPVIQQSAVGVGLEGVNFVQFGIRLTFIPIVTDKNRIRLRMNADVSDPNPALSADINGTSVPGLTTRNFTSTVELRDGQTLAVAGLLKNDYSAKSSKVPLIGEVPIVGQLFGNSSTTYAERELIFLVTPYLAAPLEEEESLGIPGTDIFEPDDLEFYICGRIEGCRREDYRSAVRTDCEKMKAFRRIQQQVIIGPSGHSDGMY